MSDCSLIRDLLPLYDDDAVSMESKEMITEHLDQCAECRSYYDHIRHIPHLLQDEGNRGDYHYSDIVKMLRRRTLVQNTVCSALLLTSAAGLAKIFLDGKDK